MMGGDVPDRDGSSGVSRRQALGLVGAVVGGGGVVASLRRSDTFTTASTDRDTQVEIKQDADAVVPITGTAVCQTPEFGNEFPTDLTITLSAPNEPSATFDVGTTGTTESVATFTVPPGTTTAVGMCADASSIAVDVDGDHGNGTVSLTRNYEISRVTVDSVSTSGRGKRNTVSHTVGSNDSRVLYVFIHLIDNSPDTDVESVDYGGTGLTEIQNWQTQNFREQVFRLTDPTSGTADVNIEIQGQETNTTAVGVMSFDSVDQVTPEGPISRNGGDAQGSTITGIDTGSCDLVVDQIGTDVVVSNGQAGPGTNQPLQWSAFAEGDSGEAGGSTKDDSGSVDMSWNIGAGVGDGGAFAHLAFNINRC